MITMQEIVRYQQRGSNAQGKVIGDFEPTGVQPKLPETLRRAGRPFRPRHLQHAGGRRRRSAWLR